MWGFVLTIDRLEREKQTIAQWASEARTALDDPAGLHEDLETQAKQTAYAIDKLDDIIRLTGANDDA